MSVERLLGKSLAHLRSNETDSALDLFRQSISEKNIKIENDTSKYDFKYTLISGAVVGSLLFVFLNKRISNNT